MVSKSKLQCVLAVATARPGPLAVAAYEHPRMLEKAARGDEALRRLFTQCVAEQAARDRQERPVMYAFMECGAIWRLAEKLGL